MPIRFADTLEPCQPIIEIDGIIYERCLIAAAPEMLATLKAIHKAILQHKMEHSDFGIDIGTLACEAIAKAEGWTEGA